MTRSLRRVRHLCYLNFPRLWNKDMHARARGSLETTPMDTPTIRTNTLQQAMASTIVLAGLKCERANTDTSSTDELVRHSDLFRVYTI